MRCLRFSTVLCVLVFVKGTLQCFSHNQFQSITIKVGSAFYQECHCNELARSLADLKWYDTQGQEIGPLSPGIAADYFTERRNRSINLHIPYVSKSISGTYRCVSESTEKEYSLTYRIEAYEPLYFIQTNSEQFIVEGTDSVIKCEARGFSPPLIAWYKLQNELFEITDDDKYEVTPQGLIVKNVNDQDSGTYKCAASVLETGEEVDKDINVEVAKAPTIKSINAFPNTSIPVGEKLQLECISEGRPAPDYVWNKTNDIPETSSEWRQEAGVLYIDKVTVEDSGIYECVVTNKAGEARRFVEIEVMYAPSIIEFDNLTALEGSTSQIVCRASGVPRPKITMMSDAAEADQDLSITWETKAINDTETAFVLTFLSVNRSHDGVYYCNASNEVGSESDEIRLNVLYKPTFFEPLELMWAWTDKSVNLSCEHESNPASQIHWSYQPDESLQEDLKETNRILQEQISFHHDLHLQLDMNASLYGVYECTAQNILGEVTKIIVVKEGHTPSAVKNVSISELAATSVIFDLDFPTEFYGPPVIGFTSEYDEAKNYVVTDIHNNRTWSVKRPFKLEKLKPKTNYYIKFAAVNEVGVGAWSDNVVFTTLEKSVPEPPSWVDESGFVSGHPGSPVFKWKTSEHNGDPVDYYILTYCPVIEDQKIRCSIERIEPTVNEVMLDELEPNTTFYLQVMAHNSVGNSSAIEAYFTTSVERPSLYSRVWKPIVYCVSTLLILMIVATVFAVCRRKERALCCFKNNKKKRRHDLRSRDEKGLLKSTEVHATSISIGKQDNKSHKETEGRTTPITGKHSSV